MIHDFQIITGLGNPGSDYQQTRHNAGFWLIERLFPEAHFQLNSRFKSLIADLSTPTQRRLIVLPQTFMNNSGLALAPLLNFYKISCQHLIVAHDELALPAGQLRFKTGGGHAGHNGLKSIIQHCQSAEFSRIRIGIGHPGNSHMVANYVLSKPSSTDRDAIHVCLEQLVDRKNLLLAGDFSALMNQLHQKN